MSELQRLLQELGLSNIGQLSDFGSGQIRGSIASHFGLQPSQLPEQGFIPFSQGAIKDVYGKKYSPFTWSKGESMLDDFTKTKYNPTIRKLSGNFAGTGEAGEYMETGAKKLFGQQMVPTLAEVEKQRMQGVGRAEDLIRSWFDIGREYHVPKV